MYAKNIEGGLPDPPASFFANILRKFHRGSADVLVTPLTATI